jgi:hypothetical protein
MHYNEMQKVLNIACSSDNISLSLSLSHSLPPLRQLGVDDGNNNQLSLEKFIYKEQKQQHRKKIAFYRPTNDDDAIRYVVSWMIC